MERGRIDMSRLQMLILDEADRMLDMGFMPDIEHICAALPAERQSTGIEWWSLLHVSLQTLPAYLKSVETAWIHQSAVVASRIAQQA